MSEVWANLTVAVPAAIAGAAFMGIASAAQARATKEVPLEKTLHPRLLLDLARRPLWLVGIGATVAGLGLQLVALGYGPLMLVQPLLVTALPFASVFSAWFDHRRIDGVVLLGTLICVAGLSAFLMIAKPADGTTELLSTGQVVLVAIALGLVALAGLAWSSLVTSPARVLGLALATGVFYGVTAGLMKLVAADLRTGWLTTFTHWSLYVVCVVGPIGFLLSQNTFQQGRLIAPALAVITTVDPLVGVVIGVWWMGESAAAGPSVLAGELIAAVAIVAGIAVLSWRNSHPASAEAAEADEMRTELSPAFGWPARR
jgi:drug/metabolite transporter (DMT)-like permease